MGSIQLNTHDEMGLSSNDHDLLIRVSTLVETLGKEVREYNTNTNVQIIDHEKRLRSLESFEQQAVGAQKNTRIAIGVLTVVGTLLGALFTLVTFIWKR